MTLRHLPVFVLATALATGPALADPSPLGTWARGDGKAKVRVDPCGEKLCATNTWIKPGTAGEKVGDVLVMSVARAGTTKWSGTAFDPQRNLNLHIDIEVSDRRMTTQGCVFTGVFCKDMAWARLDAAK